MIDTVTSHKKMSSYYCNSHSLVSIPIRNQPKIPDNKHFLFQTRKPQFIVYYCTTTVSFSFVLYLEIYDILIWIPPFYVSLFSFFFLFDVLFIVCPLLCRWNNKYIFFLFSSSPLRFSVGNISFSF